MKRFVIAGLAVLVGASMAMAADPVYSVNSVGYQTFNIPADKAALIRLDFERMDGGYWTPNNLLGTSLPNDVVVYYWDSTTQGWQSENYLSFLGIWDPGTAQWMRGDSLFIQMLGAAGQTNAVTVTGEVPGANNGATNTVQALVTGYTGVSYPYPQPVNLEDIGLSTAAGTDNLVLYYWDTTLGWQGVNWLGILGFWDPAGVVLQPGQGYLIYKEGSGVNWVEDKPYSWP